MVSEEPPPGISPEVQRQFKAELDRGERYAPSLIGLDEATAMANALASGFRIKVQHRDLLA